jgi:hypothetical protein
MAYSEKGSMKLEAFNGLHDTVVKTSLNDDNYAAVESVLAALKLAVRKVTERRFIPVTSQVQGNGTAAQYKMGKIWCKRPTKTTVCIKGLVPVDSTAVNALKSKLLTQSIGGELPTSINVTYDAI